MDAPPGNASAPLAKGRREKLIVPGGYHVARLGQTGIVWSRWCCEAQRLFAEYWRTANAKHLSAFTKHVHGMRSYGGPRK